jgi:hypothetical protein
MWRRAGYNRLRVTSFRVADTLGALGARRYFGFRLRLYFS